MKPTENSQATNDLNPYLAGFGVGLVLLASFVIVGRGISSIAGFSSFVSAGLLTMFPLAAHHGPFLAEQATRPPWWREWTVLLGLSIFFGGLASALLRRGVRLQVSRGSHVSTTARLLCVLGGGILMGLGAKIAGGCTSGQILSGGALLGTGSWVFMATVFAAAYSVSWFVRRWLLMAEVPS